MLATIALVLAAAQSQTDVYHRGPHPAFTFSSELAQSVFQNGLDDGANHKDPDSIWGPLTRGIGDIHNGYTSETVSWLWAYPWQATVYQYGLKARKEAWTDDQIKSFQDSLTTTDQHASMISFRADLCVKPSFDDKGEIDRYADAGDLANVKMYLKVGNQSYEPLQQPGAPYVETKSDTRNVNHPETQTTTSETTIEKNGKKVTKEETSTTSIDHYCSEEYTWYESVFDVWFDLQNPDGSFRVTPADKDIDVVIVYGGNERHAKFNLDNFLYTKSKVSSKGA